MKILPFGDSRLAEHLLGCKRSLFRKNIRMIFLGGAAGVEGPGWAESIQLRRPELKLFEPIGKRALEITFPFLFLAGER